MREVLDSYSSESFAPVFKDFHERLRRHHHLKEYEILPNILMCVIDGTQHYSSKSFLVNAACIKRIRMEIRPIITRCYKVQLCTR